MAVYAYIDVSKKQEYIYKNSKLKDNLYRSFIIKAVTEELTGKIEMPDDDKDLETIIFLERYLNDNFPYQYAFQYSGGGNSIIRFETLENAVRFVRGYSFKVLEAYPDMELYISLVDSEKDLSEDQGDKDIRDKLIERGDKLKDKRRSRFKRWSYGIEAIMEGGQPEQIQSRGQKVTDEKIIRIIRQYLFKKFEDALGNVVRLTPELQDYKKEDGKSYIGVISIDGNKMGKMAKKIDSFDKLKTFSETIEKIYFNAIVEALENYRHKIGAKEILLTPVLQSGDDVCLIVEAEHAIKIAADIIDKIATNSLRDCNQEVLQDVIGPGYLTACGGVAIARYSYPFFEAVKIAERLCHRAKESIHSVKTMEEKRQRNCFIHWEVVQSQVTTGISYESYVKDRNIQERFHIKPLCIDQTDIVQDDIYSYEAFIKLVMAIQNEKDISSFLENLKKQMYGGIEPYRLFLETNKQNSNTLKDLVGTALNEDMAKMVMGGNGKQITYILNDVLEALPFMAKMGEGFDGTGK